MKPDQRLPCARRFAQPLALSLAVLAAGAWNRAVAEVVDIAWDANGRFERSLNVAPAKFAEVCGKLPAGLKLRWDFAAGAPLDFNVHYHLGKEVLYAAKMSAVASAKDTLETKTEQDYCWMWTNKSAWAATLVLKLQR
jgi:hypothetical protein